MELMGSTINRWFVTISMFEYQLVCIGHYSSWFSGNTLLQAVTTTFFSRHEGPMTKDLELGEYMIPVPGSLAPPPMVWSPTPWPRIFHFHGIYRILDAKPHISMYFHGICTSLDEEPHISLVCTAFWMENILIYELKSILILPLNQGTTTTPHHRGGKLGTMTMGGGGGGPGTWNIYIYK